MFNDITGVILAGGRSTRMGADKALVPFRGRPLIQSVIDTMRAVFSRVVLSVNPRDSYPQFGLPAVIDNYEDAGPIGGITSVFSAGEERIFCVACDMPFLKSSLIEFQCTLPDCEAVIPLWHGKVEVLHALYSRAVLAAFHAAIAANRFSVKDAVIGAHVRYVHEEEIRKFDPAGLSFRNFNTPDSLREPAEP